LAIFAEKLSMMLVCLVGFLALHFSWGLAFMERKLESSPHRLLSPRVGMHELNTKVVLEAEDMIAHQDRYVFFQPCDPLSGS
jgi:hypothetical protein